MSDDGQHGLTLIAFIGSVFSPYYAFARRRGDADPRDYCAVNVALYGPRGKRWAMTERRRGSLQQDASRLSIGRSALSWDGDDLSIDIDELTVPLPTRIRGRIKLHPFALVQHCALLEVRGQHCWRPLAPCARVEVMLQSPALQWSGAAYLDSNFGDAPLEDSLSHWHWSRANLSDGTAVIYDVAARSGEKTSLALRFDPRGGTSEFAAPPLTALPKSGWGIARDTRAEDRAASVVRTLEDTPFYARSLLSSRVLGEPVTAMHESLDLNRFRKPWVQAMLPFRMPRARR